MSMTRTSSLRLVRAHCLVAASPAHTDLWMGPSFGSANTPLINCEDSLTLGNTYAGTGTIIVDPPADLTVNTNPLFINDYVHGAHLLK
jgi:hypothetical protein